MTPFLAADLYNVHLLIFGLITFLAATVPNLLKNRTISAPIIYLLIGVALYYTSDEYSAVAAINNVDVIKKISEFVVIIALTNAGLKIQSPFKWETWKYSFWLLAVTMPITIILSSWISWWILGLAPAAAILYGALISPTDPVLAADLQTTEPSKKDHSKTRLALTSEAGLNDGLAFPFTYFAIYLASKGEDYENWIGSWLLNEVLYKIAAGVLIGYIIGWLLFQIIFRIPSQKQASKISRGILSLALTVLPYAVTELFSGYGFIAVFIAACAFSNSEKNVKEMDNLHDFTEEIERIFVAFLFVVIGLYAIANADKLLDWDLILTALVLILIIRPVGGWISLMRSDLSHFQRFVLSFYGIRGVGSIFYLTYAFTQTDFPDAQRLIHLTAVTIILSVLIHGISAASIQKKLDRMEKK